MRRRFSIRDLFWLTAIVAILLAWLIDHRQFGRLNVEAADQITSLTKEIATIKASTDFEIQKRDNEIVQYQEMIQRKNQLDLREEDSTAKVDMPPIQAYKMRPSR
jgi:hypothetical protein